MCLVLVLYLLILTPKHLPSLCLLRVTCLRAPDVSCHFGMVYSAGWMFVWVWNGCKCGFTLWTCVIVDMCLGSSEGGEDLQSRSKLLCLLDSVTDALVWAISKTGLSFQQRSTRLAHLLMLLSHIRHVRYSVLNSIQLYLSSAFHGNYHFKAALQHVQVITFQSFHQSYNTAIVLTKKKHLCAV